MVKEKQVGVISNYFENIKVVAIKLSDSLKLGDVIKIVGGETNFNQPIESIQINHKQVSSAKKGDEIGIKVKEKARKDYKVFKISSK